MQFSRQHVTPLDLMCQNKNVDIITQTTTSTLHEITCKIIDLQGHSDKIHFNVTSKI